jgi:hypothetical protein
LPAIGQCHWQALKKLIELLLLTAYVYIKISLINLAFFLFVFVRMFIYVVRAGSVIGSWLFGSERKSMKNDYVMLYGTPVLLVSCETPFILMEEQMDV